MKISDTLSLSAFQFSSYSLYQIFALLTINHGISLIERELITFQPPVPPLPPGPESYKVTDTSKCNFAIAARKPTVRARRNTTWIEEMEISSPETTTEETDDSDFDFDLDKIVDAKLSQLSENQEQTEANNSRERITFSEKGSSPVSSPRRTMTLPNSSNSSNSSWKRPSETPKSRGVRKANMLQRKPSKQLDSPRS
uniref:Uncharacterized protein n=1 Tax=Vannella robusta TaxID=1487602 RepID=A0A7S4I2J8_9EUKA|mmetsp:Transcript_19320/g.24426  ORF Transcript_19320/g.24426 Transcript_19320/m.24426 type:complete len:197 (+) Transcript_19320:356-946(+)